MRKPALYRPPDAAAHRLQGREGPRLPPGELDRESVSRAHGAPRCARSGWSTDRTRFTSGRSAATSSRRSASTAPPLWLPVAICSNGVGWAKARKRRAPPSPRRTKVVGTLRFAHPTTCSPACREQIPLSRQALELERAALGE